VIWLGSLWLGISLGCGSPSADPPSQSPQAIGSPSGDIYTGQESTAAEVSPGAGDEKLGQVLLPPESRKDTLVPVPLPDLSLLGAEVQEQLHEAQAALAEVCREPDVTATSLSSAYGEMGRLYHAYDLLDAAEACYCNAQALDPNAFRWSYFLADVRRWQGNVEQTIAAFEAALRVDPDYVPALVALGEIRWEIGQADEAEALFARAMELNPNAAALVGLGKIAAARQDFDAAVRHYEAALAQQPTATAIHYPLAMAYRGKGDMDSAQTHALQRGDTRARVADPLLDRLVDLKTGAEHHEKRGVAAGKAGNLERAVTELRAAVKASPENHAARLNLGTALALSGDLDAAIAQYREAIRLEPKSSQAHFNLAVLLAKRADVEAALDHFRQAVQLDPHYLTAHLGLADLAIQTGDLAAAAAHYGRVVEIEPRHRAARLGQAEALTRAGRYHEACQRLMQARDVLPEDVDLTHALARLLATCPDDALRDGPRALELALSAFQSRNSPRHAETVAMAYAELGDFAQAVHWQEQIVQGAEKAGRNDLLPGARRNLALYRDHQACRMPWPADPPQP
jgi:tetratricopeptide (TPR) repeat protein